MASKIEVAIFNGKGNFLLWRKKMKVVLVLMNVAKGIYGSFPAVLPEDKKLEIDEIALSTIILHLYDNVLRKVDDVITTSEIWYKLEQLYLMRDVKNAIKYGHDSLSLDMVISSLKSKDIEIKFESKSEGLSARGRSFTRNSGSTDIKGKNRDHSRCTSRNKGQKYYYYKKEGHMMIVIRKRKMIKSYKKYEGGQVLLGDDHSCQMVGIGNVQFKLYNGTVRTLSSVRYVSGLRRNLISLNMLDDAGYTSKTENGKMKISKGSFVALKCVKKNGLYVLLSGVVFNSCNASVHTPVDNTMLAHNRLGHISENGLYYLNK
ncbi:uncharacterized protein LOC132800132 [Ziziphus jujuba]|uniref:Uncharacterized protein LOC132800132 n=1 Tax=Ziziphus jujuba TaxID=326968 RepID=A0ABM3ZXC6_ZIZJJ|nr:uncharacterized protein LOC132800132 [Ziziphus jujuba]